ncbi:MAG: 3-hydroxyacyl-CoA dehydrogenase [Acidimicrobiia bacterium]|nr:3-hydroxyacyl-CoA dehydrogenase [Acidimicrobiia bacterium]
MIALATNVSVAVLGSGTMGRGIARVASGAGHKVFLYDIDNEALGSAATDIKRYLDRDVEKGRLSDGDAQLIYGRIAYTAELPELATAGLVIEAIVEDLEAKVALLRQVEAQTEPGTIIATNTSSLSVTAIAAGLERAERVAGMHFFNPAPVMPLVEIVAGAQSDHEVLATLSDTAEAWGKTPVRAASTPGFIVNRVARPFYGEALRIVEEGLATPREVDEVVAGAGGFRMGPFALMDLVGLDVNLAVSKSVYEQTFHDPRFAPNQIQQQLVDAGRLGLKTGRGFYNYEADGHEDAPRSATANHQVAEVIVHGDRAGTNGLVSRLTAAGVKVSRGFGPAPGVAIGSTLLWPSNGRPVSAVDKLVPDLNIVAVDACLDWPSAEVVAIAGGDQSAEADAAAVLGAAGLEARVVGDGPGLVLLRIMCQLASVAADAVLKGVATVKDVDTAMRLGTNYPIGPLEWADQVGAGRVVEVLDNMADYYGEARYRPSSLLRRTADNDVQLGEAL